MSENSIMERINISNDETIAKLLSSEGTNNEVILRGTLLEEFQYSHMYQGKPFYKSKISVRRKSGVKDIIPSIISQELFESLEDNLKGKNFEFIGKIHTHDVSGKDGKHHLVIFFSVHRIREAIYGEELKNLVFLRGNLCRKMFFRVKSATGTPILDFFIAVKEGYANRDNIPCIAWYDNAEYIHQKLKATDEIELIGRIQSRTYFKYDSKESDSGKPQTTYEIAVSEVRLISDK